MKSISSKKLNGNILIPGDKSISHRLIILSSIDIGISPSKIIDEKKLLLNLKFQCPNLKNQKSLFQ